MQPSSASRRAVLGSLAGAAACVGAGGLVDRWSTGPAAATAPAAAGASAGWPSRPNVVVVSVDDLGWRELGCYGHDLNETPEIDRLAAQGLRFTSAYAAGPLCSPTRAALMTGLYPARTGITSFLRPQQAPGTHALRPGTPTLPDALARAGYTSGLIGKWHLTEDYTGRYPRRFANPYALGFDQARASEQRYIAGGDYVAPYSFMPGLRAPRGEYLTDRLADEAADFITDHRDRPFFLHVSNYAVHERLHARPELLAKYRAKARARGSSASPALAAMLESVDHQVGRIVRTLAGLGLADRTLLLVTSDNGAPRPAANRPLRGGKGQLYEGGLRVPLVAHWPGTVAPGVDATMTSTIDLLPTAVELAGGQPRRGLDGVSLAPVLTGTSRLTRETLYWVHRPGFDRRDTRAAVRVGDLKLIRQRGRSELFDLGADPGERHDLARRRPKTARGMRRLLDEHVDDVDRSARR